MGKKKGSKKNKKDDSFQPDFYEGEQIECGKGNSFSGDVGKFITSSCFTCGRTFNTYGGQKSHVENKYLKLLEYCPNCNQAVDNKDSHILTVPTQFVKNVEPIYDPDFKPTFDAEDSDSESEETLDEYVDVSRQFGQMQVRSGPGESSGTAGFGVGGGYYGVGYNTEAFNASLEQVQVQLAIESNGQAPPNERNESDDQDDD